ncbi:MAG: glycosyltransferase family 39 protein [Caldilineaceae bacterium]|nr:glycosyltransferase family 39 protein [Caldilineaceae bacterium]
MAINWRRVGRRWLLLLLILLAFARVVYRLDGNNLWWDESLSLQRAEQAWLPLLRGDLIMRDAFAYLPSTDQHPFFFFILLGLLTQFAGISEFVLRYPSVMGATLLVPSIWVLGQWLVRRQVLPATTGLWAAGFAALHPFFLWFGQEARPYALWATLGILSTYLLLRNTESHTITWGWFGGYLVATALFLTTHYFAVFWLPLHALVIYQWLRGRNRWLGFGIPLLLLAGGLVVGLIVMWTIWRQGGGGNFPTITLRNLLPDLLNAYSLGLSVKLDDPLHWLGWLFGLLAFLGIGYGMRSQQAVRRGGWLLPVALLLPIGMILLLNVFQPAYMNARHLSLLAGVFIVLVGAGLALVWRVQRWGAALVATGLVAGLLYSSVNYFTQPAFGKDHYAELGNYLRQHLLPGDLLLLDPPFSERVFRYYLPIDQIETAARQGRVSAYANVPLLFEEWPATYAYLAELLPTYRRVWLAQSGSYPLLDPDTLVQDWLRENAVWPLRDVKFFSPNAFLDLSLFLTQPPVYEGLEPPTQNQVNVTFGEQVRLVGYDIEAPLTPTSALPITLYWQVDEKPEIHYKYILQLVEQAAEGDPPIISQLEQEPYNGAIPTIWWDPGKTIVEYTNLPPLASPLLASPTGRYQLALQLYKADSLEKLTIQTGEPYPISPDGHILYLPFTWPE